MIKSIVTFYYLVLITKFLILINDFSFPINMTHNSFNLFRDIIIPIRKFLKHKLGY